MKRALAILGATAAVTAGLAVTAPTASAANACTSHKFYDKGKYTVQLPATSSGSSHCVMGPGASGYHVERLQHALSICHGLDVGAASGSGDGIYGPKTAKAVKIVQSRANIAVDGVYGPQTRNAISWRWYGGGGAKCAKL